MSIESPTTSDANQSIDVARKRLQLYINLKLASTGQPANHVGDHEFWEIAHDLLESYREKNRFLTDYICPVDKRIQDFLNIYLADCEGIELPIRLPRQTLILDRPGVARELSLPANGDVFKSEIVSSYRVRQGILHNPLNDRRTTRGSFHIAEGGLPIPNGDKKTVPKAVFARLLLHALNPPSELLELPFTSDDEYKAKLFVSLLLRPVVCPEIPNVALEKSMEIRCFAPGNLVSNLDFLEIIFGNAGNPYLPKHDAALDIEHWTGHTGCIILAPHLIKLSKKELGLPHYDEATERQKHDGMCWKDENEPYNEGVGFKITARDMRGVIVTILADNYFGYCKKEVKTQITYAANLFGLAEEEHAGGALAFRCHNHGNIFDKEIPETRSFDSVVKQFGEIMDVKEEGYAIDKEHPDLLYVPMNVRVDAHDQTIKWTTENGEQRIIDLEPKKTYMLPNGYKIEMHKHPAAPTYRLIGIEAEGIFCHKPCTVSGGGKSEISKSIENSMNYSLLFVEDLEKDLDQVQAIFDYDYSQRLKPEFFNDDREPSRPLLSIERSLGSVIRMLTPSFRNTDAYNAWLESIPPHILSQVFIIKRSYEQEWENGWREHFTVDIINGTAGHALKVDGRELKASYIRVGQDKTDNWRTFKVRQDFIATEKIQLEDDISVSVVVPKASLLNCSPKSSNLSVKLVKNCEQYLFQRPDEAKHRGIDKQTEFDMAQPNNFIANFEPLIGDKLKNIVRHVEDFEQFTPPMRNLLQAAACQPVDQYVVSSAHARLVGGFPSKNPRYLQQRLDNQYPIRSYIAEMGARLSRQVPLNQELITPVNAVLLGRRNNPKEAGTAPLAVYNPIHYQELPELFMDFICSLTGSSPSTTGAGSEGALTKGPFNALRSTADLNNALVSFILTGYAGFSSPAYHIGPDIRVEHDISLLIPEIWACLSEEERDPEYLIRGNYLELVPDLKYEGRSVSASRLGYRINERFAMAFLSRIFDSPQKAMGNDILKPETQDLAEFVEGIDNITNSHKRIALQYIEDGSINDACPPIKVLLTIMAEGNYQGMDERHPKVRALFTRDYLLASDWYALRLQTKQQRDIELWQRHCSSLQNFLKLETHIDVAESLNIKRRLKDAIDKLAHIRSDAYLESLRGTIGADLLGRYPEPDFS